MSPGIINLLRIKKYYILHPVCLMCISTLDTVTMYLIYKVSHPPVFCLETHDYHTLNKQVRETPLHYDKIWSVSHTGHEDMTFPEVILLKDMEGKIQMNSKVQLKL